MPASCPMKKPGFHNHMRDKAKQWDVSSLHLGDDYAVFQFKFKYRCDEAHLNLQQYQGYYGYRMEKDKERLVIINTNGA